MRRSIPERLVLVDRHLALWAMVGQPTGHDGQTIVWMPNH